MLIYHNGAITISMLYIYAIYSQRGWALGSPVETLRFFRFWLSRFNRKICGRLLRLTGLIGESV